MSVIVKFASEIKSLALLEKAAKHLDLDFRYDSSFRTHRAHQGKGAEAVISLSDKLRHELQVKPGSDYEIGVIANNGNYDLVYDRWNQQLLETVIGAPTTVNGQTVACPKLQMYYHLESTLAAAQANGDFAKWYLTADGAIDIDIIPNQERVALLA